MDDHTKALVADAVGAIVALHDLDHNILWANAAYCEATGLDLDEIVGMKCWEAWGLSGVCRGCPVVTAVEEGQRAEAELTPWDQEHWPESQGSWLSKATPVRDSAGQIVGVVESAFDITELVATRRSTEAQAHELGERVKELRCLIGVLEAARSSGDLDELMRRSVELLPPGWHYPEITVARIRIDERESSCGDFAAAVAVQTADIVAGGELRGRVEVGYTEEREPLDEGPFLRQERDLIDAIALKLSLAIERIEGESWLRASNQQLRATEQQLRNLQARDNALLGHSPVCHKIVDRDLNLQYMSACGFEMLKLDETDELYGKPYPFEFFPEAAREALRDGLARVLQSKKKETLESRACDVEGNALWLHHSLIPVLNEDEAVDYLTVVSADITERRRAEQTLRRFEWLDDKEQAALEHRKEAYTPPYGDVTELNTCRVIRDAVGAEALGSMARDLMDLLDTSVAVYEANGDYAFGLFESSWCRLMDGASFARCGTADRRQALDCGAWLCHEACWNDSATAAIRSRAPSDIECVGGLRLYGAPIFAGRECVGAVNIGYGTPPTDEESLRALAERFELPLEEIRAAAKAYKPRPRFIIDVAKRRCRTAARMIGDAVEKARLEAQLAQADRLSSMGTLAAGVAHEINNPLAYTLYNLETVVEDLPGILSDYRRMVAALGYDHPELASRRGLGPAELDDLLARGQEALEGARRIRGITRSLGTFARVEDDEVQPVNVRHAVEHARNMAQSEIKYRARLLLDLPPAPAVLGSAGKLSQVFLNLLINAAQAIDEGDVESNTIRVRSYTNADQVVVEVSDTGKGIPTEHLGRLFDPFFTTKAVGQGSGLGLSISKKIVSEMGGDITCESEEGKGTTFRIRLPVMPSDRSRGSAAGAAKPDKPGDAVCGRILAVDDEAGIRASLSRMLGRDHEVVTASSGAEGKEILERDQAFDLIILDLMMPQVSGMDLHRWLVEHYPAVAERVIFVTGGVFTPKTRNYLSEVDNLLLEKPLDTALFKKLVRELISNRSG